MPQQAFAGTINQIEHRLKTIMRTVMRIWHHRAVRWQAELGEATHLVLMFNRTFAFKQGKVVPIHRQKLIGPFDRTGVVITIACGSGC